MSRLGSAIAALLVAFPALAETVEVKYFGPVGLASYECDDTVSSFVHRICYDDAAAQVVVRLNGTYYAYCRMDEGTVAAWLAAESKGRFYNQFVKGRFSCAE